MQTTPRSLKTFAALALVGAMIGCGGTKDHVREAIERELNHAEESRLAELFNCYLPEAQDPVNGAQLALSAVRVGKIKLLGTEGEGHIYEAEVELTADSTRLQGVTAPPRGPVKVTLWGVATHEVKVRFMYIFPGIFSESGTTPTQLLARGDFPIKPDRRAAPFANDPLPAGPRLDEGQPVTTALPARIPLSPSGELRYDDLRIAAHAGEVLRISVMNGGKQPVGAWLRPAPPLRMQTLQAQIAQPGVPTELAYDAPADAELHLRIWTRGDPGGPSQVTLRREKLPKLSNR